MTSGVTEPLQGALRETPHGRPAPQSQAACLEAARHGWPAGPRVGTPEPLTIRELWGSACRPVQRGRGQRPRPSAGLAPGCAPAASSRSPLPVERKPAGRGLRTRVMAFLHVIPAPTSPGHLRGLFLERGGFPHSELLGKKRHRALERGSCDPEAHFSWPVRSSRLLASRGDRDRRAGTRGQREVARTLLGSFTSPPRPRGRGPQAGDRPVQIPGALSHGVWPPSQPGPRGPPPRRGGYDKTHRASASCSPLPSRDPVLAPPSHLPPCFPHEAPPPGLRFAVPST